MAEKRSKPQPTQGTFAQLYDVQEELKRRNVKPLGRPRKQTQRKPTTVHLTKIEIKNLGKLQLLLNDQFTVNRSELIGVAIDALALLVEKNGPGIFQNGQARDVETLRRLVCDFIKS